MKEALSDILNSYNGMVSDVLISRYIQGKASTDEIRHIEHLMLEDPFLADAIEGLKEGTWDLHDKNITELKKTFAKPKPSAFKLSVASVAVAASVVLITYFGFNASMFKKAEEAASDTQMSAEQKVEKHTHVSVLKETNDSIVSHYKRESDVSLLRIPPAPKKSSEVATDSIVGGTPQTQDWISLDGNAGAPAPAAEKAKEEEYVSKDKNFDKKRSVVLDDEIELAADEVAEPVMSNASQAPVAKQKSDLFFAQGSQFIVLAQNTKGEIFDLEEREFKKEKSKSVSKKKLKSSPKCTNCPDKGEIAEVNAVGDTIASNKATSLYEQGAYAEAAKWYYRQPDVESKVMAGLSYLQASDTNSCKEVERVLFKVNVNAANYLKALRLYYEGSESQSLALFQKLVDNNSKYKRLAAKNKQAISTK